MKANKSLWTKKSSQQNMPLFDRIVQPQSIINLECEVLQKVGSIFSILLIDIKEQKKRIA